jgi:hypothetical protein
VKRRLIFFVFVLRETARFTERCTLISNKHKTSIFSVSPCRHNPFKSNLMWTLVAYIIINSLYNDYSIYGMINRQLTFLFEFFYGFLVSFYRIYLSCRVGKYWPDLQNIFFTKDRGKWLICLYLTVCCINPFILFYLYVVYRPSYSWLALLINYI